MVQTNDSSYLYTNVTTIGKKITANNYSEI